MFIYDYYSICIIMQDGILKRESRDLFWYILYVEVMWLLLCFILFVLYPRYHLDVFWTDIFYWIWIAKCIIHNCFVYFWHNNRISNLNQLNNFRATTFLSEFMINILHLLLWNKNVKKRHIEVKVCQYEKKGKCNHAFNEIAVSLVEYEHNGVLEEREHLQLLIKLITRHIVTVFVGKLLLQSTILLWTVHCCHE